MSAPHHTLHYRYTACLVSLIHTTHCCAFSLPGFPFVLSPVVHCPFISCQVMHSCKFFLPDHTFHSLRFDNPVCLTVCHTFVVCIWSFLHISCCHTCHGKCTAQNEFFERTWCLSASASCDIVLLHCIQC